MDEMMQFPNTVEEFMKKYKIVDKEQVYTNSAELVPIFRMKQWFISHPCEPPRWIPVTERLPEKIGNYLVTCLDGGRQIDLGYWHTDECREGFWSCNWCDANSVIAWMPLPEPYKEGEEE